MHSRTTSQRTQSSKLKYSGKRTMEAATLRDECSFDSRTARENVSQSLIDSIVQDVKTFGIVLVLVVAFPFWVAWLTIVAFAVLSVVAFDALTNHWFQHTRLYRFITPILWLDEPDRHELYFSREQKSSNHRSSQSPKRIHQ